MSARVAVVHLTVTKWYLLIKKINGVPVAYCFVFYVEFCRPLHCLSPFDLRLLTTTLISSTFLGVIVEHRILLHVIPNHTLWSFLRNGLKWWVVVSFVDISEDVDHHCLNVISWLIIIVIWTKVLHLGL